jgi:hypothetical protein
MKRRPTASRAAEAGRMLGGACLAVLLAGRPDAGATTNAWITGGSAWHLTTGWSQGVLPASTHSLVAVNNGGTKTVAINSVTVAIAPGSMTISNLYVDSTPGFTNTLLVDTLGTNVPFRVLNDVVVGSNGVLRIVNSAMTVEGAAGGALRLDGRVELTGGLLSVSGLGLGFFHTGQVQQSGGRLSAAGNVLLGMLPGAGGRYTQTGGTNVIGGYLSLGFGAGTMGRYDLAGGRLSVPDRIIVGDVGSGVFNQAGGSNETGILFVGGFPGSSGTYRLSNGWLTAAVLDVGGGAAGTFEQAGGTNQSELVWLGRFNGASGDYQFANGRLRSAQTFVGEAGGGTFIQAGGSHESAVNLVLGVNASGTGAYHLHGGQLVTSNLFVGNQGAGTFTQTGGFARAEGVLTVADKAGSTGVVTLTDGSVVAQDFTVAAGGNGRTDHDHRFAWILRGNVRSQQRNPGDRRADRGAGGARDLQPDRRVARRHQRPDGGDESGRPGDFQSRGRHGALGGADRRAVWRG